MASTCARVMFDGMPPGNRRKDKDAVPAEISGNRIGALPDALLQHVLSLLPAEEAVRTSVLARRWRYLWKSTAGLRLGCLDVNEPVSVNALRNFVDSVLLLRGGSPLDTFELSVGDFSGDDDEPCVNLWFWHAVTCKVRELKLHVHLNDCFGPWLWLDDVTLVSQQLTSLQLHGVCCFTGFLNFSSCPALERLEFNFCDLSGATEISSESLKSLSIMDSTFCVNSRMAICAPNLIALCLDDLWSRTPILESMPSLVDAFVQITMKSSDRCHKLQGANQACHCEYCDSSNNNAYGCCVLLKGLSDAKKLALIGTLDTFIFKKDLRWCPTFSKLKTLLLNENWCVPDLHALACIPEHAPNLEKLTLQLFSKELKHKVEINGGFSLMDRSAAISDQLKIVEVKCEVIDERVLKVLQFLCTFGISFRF